MLQRPLLNAKAITAYISWAMGSNVDDDHHHLCTKYIIVIIQCVKDTFKMLHSPPSHCIGDNYK